MAKKVYITEFDADGKPYYRTLSEMEKKTHQSMNRIGDSVKNIGASIATYFGGREIYEFAKDSIMLASKLQGVKTAFDRLGSSENVLERLRKATRGTVSDLQLMQAAVKADNFKIPLDLLSKGLEFANKRAIQTGESVEYMVDSFITGVARKSIPILDNLGISQLQLNAEIAKTGDFYQAIGNIVAQENLKMSSSIDNTAEAMQRLNATIENNKAALGEKLLPLWGSFLGITNELLSSWDTLGTLLTGNFINAYSNAVLKQNQYAGGNRSPVTPYSYDSLVSDQNNAMLSLFKNSKPITQTGTQGGRAPIPMLNGRLMDNPQRYLEAVLGNAGVRGGDVMDLGLSNIPGMGSIDVPEIKNNFEEIGTSFVDKFGELNGIASQFGNLLGIGADTFVGKMIQGMDTVSQIFGLITSIVNFASGGGPITSLLGLAEGGTVINKNGKLSYVPIPKFATGGSYMVPPGYANDSGLIRVQSGERVDVTPSGQVPILSKLLSSIDSKLGAANITNSRKGGQPILLSINLDGKKIATSVFGYENNFNKRGVDKTLLRGDSGV